MKMRNTIWYMFFLLALAACRKPYEPAVIKVNYNYLVIDGVINANPNGVTTIQLSRTKNLSDSLPPKPETGAQVVIEGEGGGSFTLIPQGNGVYNSAPLNLSSALKYRLRINTSGGGVYQSDYVPVKQTPPIDSLSWKQKPDSPNKAVTIFAHTHDPQNKTLFYRWDHVETWQYVSQLQGFVSLDSRGRAFYTDSTTQTSNCWSNTLSTNIATASSEALSQDVISYAPVQVVPQNDERMAVRYSINVKQYGLTKEAYSYWEIIKKSSQQTGSIFDPQPAQVLGNLHCISNPEEPVIGYASASFVTEKRIFIGYRELDDWHFPNAPGSICKTDVWPTNQVDFSIFTYPDTSYQPFFYSGTNTIVAKKVCLDCRRHGGTNAKPGFWQ
ncbi:MAG: hypothetical protein JWQ30_2254 [Sediminibacterium sp.]|nr:hypothetical protein [Sediminibacterium sp.]